MNAIEINNIDFSYTKKSSQSLINIAHWHVKQGEQLFMYGPSGSGKSTLLNLICGINTVKVGAISVLGKSLNTMTNRQRDKFRAENIGYIFQQFNLISYLSAIENIKLAKHFSTSKNTTSFTSQVHSLLSSLKLTPEDWHRPVSQLSVGQQQRVGIARALINAPKLIIADEPTSSLDQSAKDSFIALLLSLCQEHATTLLFVSHDMSLQKHFSSSIALADINSLNNMNQQAIKDNI